MNTARSRLAGAGLQPAALAFGGNNGTAVTAVTEEYNEAGPATATLSGS